MKKLLTIALLLILSEYKAQCPWSYSITNVTGSYSITCTTASISLSASNNNSNTVNYLWTGPSFTSNISTATVNAPGTYSLIATDAVTTCSMVQTFTIYSNFLAPITSLSPLSNTINCTPAALNTFTGIAINPTVNILHEIYSPLAPYPAGPPMQTSNQPTIVLGGAAPVGVFTLATTDLSNGCVTLKTFTIIVNQIYPTFSVNSNSGYYTGCTPATFSFSSVNPPAPAVSFTMLLPTFTGSVPNGVILSSNTSTSTNIPGTWTLIAQENTSFCRTAFPVPILQNTVVIPSFNYTVNGAGLVSYQSASSGTNAGTTYNWDFGDGTTGTGNSTSHTYSNGGVHQVMLSMTNPSCNTSNIPVNVNTIPCTANSGFTVMYSGTPLNWYAIPNYYGNITNVQWDWGDGSSDNTMFPVHTYSAAGLYNVCLTVTVSCANTSSTCAGYSIYKISGVNNAMAMVTLSVLPKMPVGIKTNELEKSEISIFPNPTREKLTIYSNSTKKINSLEILNAFGQQLIEIKEPLINQEIHLAELPEGIYFLKVNSGSIPTVFKIIKE